MSFLTPLKLEYLDGRNFKLIDQFTYTSKDYGTVTVPDGFITDFASIPEIFWNILPPTGKYGKAAVIHDWLYRNPYTQSRKLADQIFEDAMKDLGVNWLVRRTMYYVVRVFGSRAYKGK